MGLFKKKSTTRRARRKAEAAALKHKAGLEAKLSAKNVRKRDKAALKADRKRAKADKKSIKAAHKSRSKEQKNQLKIAETNKAAAEAGKIDAKRIGRYLGVARVVAPVAVPLAYRGATALRGQLDQRRAHKLGVSVDDLGKFTGAGAGLSARISGAARTLDKLEAQQPKDAEVSSFVGTQRSRLKDLATAVDAAESMPAQRQRDAHSAITRELDAIDADVLARLGVR